MVPVTPRELTTAPSASWRDCSHSRCSDFCRSSSSLPSFSQRRSFCCSDSIIVCWRRASCSASRSRSTSLRSVRFFCFSVAISATCRQQGARTKPSGQRNSGAAAGGWVWGRGAHEAHVHHRAGVLLPHPLLHLPLLRRVHAGRVGGGLALSLADELELLLPLAHDRADVLEAREQLGEELGDACGGGVVTDDLVEHPAHTQHPAESSEKTLPARQAGRFLLLTTRCVQ